MKDSGQWRNHDGPPSDSHLPSYEMPYISCSTTMIVYVDTGWFMFSEDSLYADLAILQIRKKKPDCTFKCKLVNEGWETHQTLQDLLALVVSAVVGHDAPVDQDYSVQEQPGAKPEQGKHQGSTTRPQAKAEPPDQTQPAAATKTPTAIAADAASTPGSTGHLSSR